MRTASAPPVSAVLGPKAPDRLTAVFGRYLLTGEEDALDEVVRDLRPQLPERYRDPVVLHLQGPSNAEIARPLDVSEPTVRTRVYRARAWVRSRWNPRTAAAVLALPWRLADLGKGAGAGTAAGASLATGGLMQRSTSLPIGLVLALGVGTLLGRTVLAPKVPEADAQASAAVASVARIHELEAKIATLETRLGEAAELTSRPKPIVIAPSTPAPVPAATKPEASSTAESAKSEPVAPRKTAQIVVPGFEKALDDVDWAEVGKNLHAMPPALTKFVTQWVKDGVVPIELAGDVQKFNGPLVSAAGRLSKSLKLANPNVAFTHPAFQANAIAAALESAGHPLDDPQRASILKLVQTAVDDEASRAGRYDERTLEVRKLIDRADVRDRFFDGVRALLTPEQRAVLGGDEWRGRVQADLYSSGLVWSTVSQGLPTTDREAFVARFATVYAGQFGVPAASIADFTTLVGEWAREIPDDFFKGEPDPRDLVGLVPVAYVTDFAKRQATLEDRTIERLKLDDAAIKKIRTFGYVLFPIHVKTMPEPK